MSIYDIIARPSVLEGFASGIQTFQNIQNRAMQNQLAKLKIAQAMNAIDLQHKEASIIRGGFQGLGGQQSPIQQQPMPQQQEQQAMPPSYDPYAQQQEQYPPDVYPQQEPAAQQQMQQGAATQNAGQQLSEIFTTSSIKDIERMHSFENVADQLASIGSLDKANAAYKAADHIRSRIKSETDQQRKDAEELYKAINPPLKEVAQMEDAGDPRAEQLYNSTMETLKNDPRWADNPENQKFFEMYQDYQPGRGKILYGSTLYANNARKSDTTKYNRVNVIWPGLEKPIAGRFDPQTGQGQIPTDQGWVNVPSNAQYISTSATGTPEQLGLTKKNIGDLNESIRKGNLAINLVQGVIDRGEKTPGAFGTPGALKELGAGIIGQFGKTGEEISKSIQSDDEIKVRNGIRMLTGQLIPVVTGDSSGRYSEGDRKQAEAVNKGLQATTSKRQAIIALKDVLAILKNGQIRDVFAKNHQGRFPTETEFLNIKQAEETPNVPIEKNGVKRFNKLWGG